MLILSSDHSIIDDQKQSKSLGKSKANTDKKHQETKVELGRGQHGR
ncbi:hypothetical protein VCRA2116O30_90174 [Vibrio crassostreae]|uniref:Uncharacterized protein n=1 Tax=Vibrio crassostreae TaxID=246167 RepID=A0ABP1WUW7_9VIBR|nr:hypothetical protein VCRA2117O37_100165 [Vibrio crassostreae]CAK1710601.1 hypothetical protein VCRA2116O31_100173 [Vibrio crassostreae]CAK1951805.1 hypothetical protein VCRA2113O324_260045 [Vibrio crassostreae]CAK1962203.1 hypothetical protein VCRA2111O320_270005 [Vibrio crassostreae]CAK2221863.1 hypothetical protein VCRA2113O322_80150 [Vibrio crassostreae]